MQFVTSVKCTFIRVSLGEKETENTLRSAGDTSLSVGQAARFNLLTAVQVIGAHAQSCDVAPLTLRLPGKVYAK